MPQGVWEVGSDPGAVQESFLLDRKMRRVERQGCSLAETQTATWVPRKLEAMKRAWSWRVR